MIIAQQTAKDSSKKKKGCEEKQESKKIQEVVAGIFSRQCLHTGFVTVTGNKVKLQVKRLKGLQVYIVPPICCYGSTRCC